MKGETQQSEGPSSLLMMHDHELSNDTDLKKWRLFDTTDMAGYVPKRANSVYIKLDKS